MSGAMYLIFYKGRGTLTDKIIRLATRSAYSHVEIVDRYPEEGVIGYTSSPRDGGVVVRQLNWNPENWDILFVPWTNGKDAMEYIRQRQGAKYDWVGIFLTHMIGLGRQSKTKWTSSEIVGEALGMGRAWRKAPGDLYEDLLYTLSKAKPIRAINVT